MIKEIEELIEEKANCIFKKYYLDASNLSLPKNIDYFKYIKDVLNKTLITPKRIKDLCAIVDLPFNDIFKQNSSVFFSPNLEEALQYLPPYVALSLFFNLPIELINILCFSEHSAHLNAIGIFPYFTKQELSDLLKKFFIFIEDNQKTLITTGWPKNNFTPSPWLFYHLSTNYPIEIPEYIVNFNKSKTLSNDPYLFFKNNFFHKPDNCKDYKDKMVPFTEFFSHSELGFMEEVRPKVLRLKEVILQQITDNFFSDTIDIDLSFQNCIKIILEHFPEDDFIKLFNIEEKYKKFSIFDNSIDGGLMMLFATLNILYQECKFEGISRLKSATVSTLREYGFKSQENIKSFYQIVQICQENSEYSKMEDVVQQSIVGDPEIIKKVSRNNQISLDIIQSYADKYLKKPLFVSLEHYPKMKNILGLEEEGKLKLTVSSLSVPATSSKKRIIPLELSPGTKWEQIVIEFIDDDFYHYKVKITTPNNPIKIVNFREMGFEDQKIKKPNIQWKFLYDLAQCRGDLTWSIASYRKRVDTNPLATSKAKKWKQRLAETLKEYFNIDEDPFYNYKQQNAYKTKFSLLPEPSHLKNLR